MRGVSETERFRVIYDAHHAAICAYFARRVARDEVEDLAAETFVAERNGYFLANRRHPPPS